MPQSQSQHTEAGTQTDLNQARQKSLSGLTFRVAQSIDDVVNAWRMAYKAYRRRDLIEPNRHRLHAAPQAAGRHSAIIIGCMNQVNVTTLTAIADQENGLPLDRIYSQELTSLRRQNRKLIEVGLFADRRDELGRTTEALFQLMRYAYYYGIFNNATDFVVAVFPRHVKFYTRAIGFEVCGPAKSYPVVKSQTVVLLRLDVQAKLKADPLPVGLEYFSNNLIPKDSFDLKFGFAADQIAGSPLESYLAEMQAAGSDADGREGNLSK